MDFMRFEKMVIRSKLLVIRKKRDVHALVLVGSKKNYLKKNHKNVFNFQNTLILKDGMTNGSYHQSGF